MLDSISTSHLFRAHLPFLGIKQNAQSADNPGILSVKSGGEGGIRTHGTLQYSGFRDRRFRPLSHLSAERL